MQKQHIPPQKPGETQPVLAIRDYTPADWAAIEAIHDRARLQELQLAGLEEAFLPLRIAAEREALFDYPGIYVAELDGVVAGFAACTDEELAWLYVDPAKMRQGIGRALSAHALQQFPGICYIEALKGNEPARRLYEQLGFTMTGIESGQMPGNEDYTVEAYVLERQ